MTDDTFTVRHFRHPDKLPEWAVPHVSMTGEPGKLWVFRKRKWWQFWISRDPVAIDLEEIT